MLDRTGQGILQRAMHVQRWGWNVGSREQGHCRCSHGESEHTGAEVVGHGGLAAGPTASMHQFDVHRLEALLTENSSKKDRIWDGTMQEERDAHSFSKLSADKGAACARSESGPSILWGWVGARRCRQPQRGACMRESLEGGA